MKKILLIVLIVAVVLTSAGIYLTKNPIKLTSEYIYDKMVSDEFEGRLPGSAGGLKTEDLLVEMFEILGLEKDGNSYLQKFEYEFYDIYSPNAINIKIEDNTKEVITLKLGSEYVPKSLVENLNIVIPLDIENDKSGNAVLTTSMSDGDFNKQNITFLKKDNISLLRLFPKDDVKIEFQTEIYDKLIGMVQNGKQPKLSVNYNVERKTLKVNNVVGKIVGLGKKENKNLLVLSAHFDHVGKIDENIFYGSIDNSSGIYALQNVIGKLKDMLNIAKMNYDIIIAAFNAEEAHMQGSKYFVEKYSQEYDNIMNINLDCITGEKEAEFYITSSSENKLALDIMNGLEENGYKCSIDDSLTSDDISFKEKGHYNSFSLIQNNLEVIHTTKDKKNLDLSLIKSFSDDIAELIFKIAKNYEEYYQSAEPMPTEESAKFIDEILAKLKFNEYIEVRPEKYPQNVIAVFNRRAFFSLQEYNDFFPENMIINDDEKKYGISSIAIKNEATLDPLRERSIINEVHTFDREKSKFSILDLYYKSGIDDSKGYAFLKKYNDPKYLYEEKPIFTVENITKDGFEFITECEGENIAYLRMKTDKGDIYIRKYNPNKMSEREYITKTELDTVLSDILENIDIEYLKEILYQDSFN